MITMGVDIGSLFSKAVILDDEKLVASNIVATTGNTADEIDVMVEEALGEAGMDRGEVECLVATGSGADLVKNSEFEEDEVTCVGMAAGTLVPGVKLTIDIGGQSITSMMLDEDGDVVDFMRNDKCASGSGRFLEVMSGAMGVEVEQVDETVTLSEKPVLLSSQCGVFAESEIITHVNEGEKMPDIIAGICDSVANIVVAQARRFGMADKYTITGGVARIRSVVRVIEEKLDGTYQKFPHDSRLAAAIGAALLGQFEEE
ncbi:MAG: 2-hydroxyglutaryl-CoA dehydratase [Actinobacteria bacterium]|nr:2-hydroxyglutaryl-CoA dehydratase [Actinomycetota bacterium]MCG2820249.1 acyl-CoA dehydratase activase [Actinomycetes bacterium]MBU4219556.1 2-hydroxyglutaryl-CoA dehydratase [Actinomycetota bacterium]MBU4358124.1 2-hydroxyglutaryl-CoA dehydratase [Actinomycetota bacterium]MBU4392346.1 2-hydroxyglutaryl-CoA dehydratase [Actinomycetota bacterium]